MKQDVKFKDGKMARVPNRSLWLLQCNDVVSYPFVRSDKIFYLFTSLCPRFLTYILLFSEVQPLRVALLGFVTASSVRIARIQTNV